jgi:hypothetical protein
MFVAFMTVLIIASAALTGGHFGLFSHVRLRYSWLIMGALVVQILITSVVPGANKALLVGLHLATYVAAGVAIWANRALPGLVIIAVGALLNGVTIALNGGTLPASAHALAAAGRATTSKDFENSGVLAHPVLSWLGDILATPSWLPFRNVISIGDVVILIGAAVLIHGVTRTIPARALARWWNERRSVEGSYA